MSSTFGRIFTLTTYGESHGVGLGGVVDGCPAGLYLEESILQKELDKRRPGTGGLAGTARQEPDTVQLLSGVFEGRTTGTPIAFHIANQDQRSRDYGQLADIWRPGHADMTYDAKYGCRDYRGGGRSSGRETAARVAGGAIAHTLLATQGIQVRAYTVEMGGIRANYAAEYDETNLAEYEKRPYFAACDAVVPQWDEALRAARAEGETLGGIVRIEAIGVPAGLGEPVFHKLDAVLAQALMSVGAVKGVEIGTGFASARLRGSENNDCLLADIKHEKGPFQWATNHAGGILGGISTGAPLVMQAAIKPIPSISKKQHTASRSGHMVDLCVGGRHDICAIPRVVPVLRAMAALVLADMLLLQRRMTIKEFFRPFASQGEQS